MHTGLPATPKADSLSVPLRTIVDILRRHRRSIAASSLATLTVATVLAFLLPARYEATAVILPPQQTQSLLASVVGQVGGLNLGMRDLGLKNPADLYIGILSSQSIADNVISHFKLRQRYGKSTLLETRKVLKKCTTIIAGNDTLIHISVEDRDPAVAAEIANRYVEELSTKNNRLAITESAQRRMFFEQQLADERAALAKAEDSLALMQRSTGVIRLEGQVEASIQTIAQLRAEIVGREVALKRLETATTAQHPEYLKLRSEIKELQSQVARLQSTRPAASGDLLVPTGTLPAAGIEYFRAVRELKYRESLYEFLAKQYEAAKIDEAKQAPVIQVVDRATAPDKPVWPIRWLLILIGGVVGFVVSSGWWVLRSTVWTPTKG